MVRDISIGLSTTNTVDKEENRGKQLERYLTTVCTELGKVGSLTDNNADVEFLIGIVGSYLIARSAGTLEEEVKEPWELFEENLFPALDNFESAQEEMPDEEGD